MQLKYILLMAGVVVILIAAFNFIEIDNDRISNSAPQSSGNQEIAPTANIENCEPTFVDGGGPYYKANSPFREKIVPDQNNGQKLIVGGKILRNDCKTIVANAVLDIWQADEAGEYREEWYRGQVKSDNNGDFSFESVVPKGYGEGTGYRPPHIHFKVFIEGKEIITSQMFFPDVKGREGFNDSYIIKLEEKNEDGSNIFKAFHNIVLPI